LNTVKLYFLNFDRITMHTLHSRV